MSQLAYEHESGFLKYDLMWQHAKQGFVPVYIVICNTAQLKTLPSISRNPATSIVLQIHKNVSDAVAAAPQMSTVIWTVALWQLCHPSPDAAGFLPA